MTICHGHRASVAQRRRLLQRSISNPLLAHARPSPRRSHQPRSCVLQIPRDLHRAAGGPWAGGGCARGRHGAAPVEGGARPFTTQPAAGPPDPGRAAGRTGPPEHARTTRARAAVLRPLHNWERSGWSWVDGFVPMAHLICRRRTWHWRASF